MTVSPTLLQRPATRRLGVLVLLGALLIVLTPAMGSIAASAKGRAEACRRMSHGYCVGRLVGPLAVSGRKIIDKGQGGVPVLFQGVMFDGPGWLKGQPSYNVHGFPDTGAINTLKAWGVNFVRLALSSDIYDQTCHEDYAGSYPAPGYRDDVTNSIKALTSAGMYVEVLLYTSNPSCKLSGGPNTSGLAPMPGQDAVTFWQAIAKEFADNPLVGFSPWNEPEVCATGASTAEPVTSTCSQSDLDAGWAKSLTMKADITYADVGMDRLFQVIHKAAPASLVFLDANGWAAQPETYASLPADMATANDLVDVLHPYDCQDRTPADKTAKQKTTAVCVNSSPELCGTIAPRLATFDSDLYTHARLAQPVVYDEVGFPEGEQVYEAARRSFGRTVEAPIKLYQHGLYLNNFIASAEARGEGFAVFTFNDSDTGSTWNGPYLLTKQPVAPGDKGPWPASVDGAVVKRAGTGAPVTCQSPPSGYDTFG
ncbi:MAG TPA: cellulase family glycosylhydrolase [Mycobacteriales bacterium]|nr:cellulase family glycosylhydrolase [Mycobacteriales bacterium]